MGPPGGYLETQEILLPEVCGKHCHDIHKLKYEEMLKGNDSAHAVNISNTLPRGNKPVPT